MLFSNTRALTQKMSSKYRSLWRCTNLHIWCWWHFLKGRHHLLIIVVYADRHRKVPVAFTISLLFLYLTWFEMIEIGKRRKTKHRKHLWPRRGAVNERKVPQRIEITTVIEVMMSCRLSDWANLGPFKTSASVIFFNFTKNFAFKPIVNSLLYVFNAMYSKLNPF